MRKLQKQFINIWTETGRKEKGKRRTENGKKKVTHFRVSGFRSPFSVHIYYFYNELNIP